MMNLSSIMGNEHYVWPTHSNNISILHFISVIQDVLQSTFKCNHFGFAPGIYLPDYEEPPPEDYYEEEYYDDGPAN